MADRVAAEVFAPGEFIADELEARGWSQIELAEVLGRPPKLVSQLITGKCAVTPETAKGLGAAFGTGAQFWMNLERDYRLAHAIHDDAGVERRARLYAKAPVKEMTNRRWIEPSGNIAVLEKRVLDFLHIEDIDGEPCLAHAAKKGSYGEVSVSQWAWLFRVKDLARNVSVPPYSPEKLAESMVRMEALLATLEDARQVPQLLADAGIRFVLVERLQQANIDGACCWLDPKSPVIGLSMRRDRIDNFWFVLRHEIEHVLRGDGRDDPQDVIIDDLDGANAGSGGSLPERERIANQAAFEFCVPNEKLTAFMRRMNLFYYEKDVIAFSRTIARHPGLVIGQMQYRLNDYKYLAKRSALYKIRQHLLPCAISDGWGQTAYSDI